MSNIQEVELPDGTVVLARLSTPDGYGADDHDVGVGVAARLEQLRELIGAVGAGVLDAARAARPDEAAVTFGVELTAKSGRALAVLAAGEATASVQVTLTWRAADRRPPTDGPRHPADPAHSPSPREPSVRPHPLTLPAQAPTQDPDPSAGGAPGGPVGPDGAGSPGSPGPDA
jgi:hypothetical protein